MSIQDETVAQIIKEFKGEADNTDPLDGDDVEVLCRLLRIKANLIEGNITEAEYKQQMVNLSRKTFWKVN